MSSFSSAQLSFGNTKQKSFRDYAKQCWNCIPARYVMCAWAFLGFFEVYALRVNLNVAMVAMVNSSSTQDQNKSVSQECSFQQNNASEIITHKEGEFFWSEREQGTILGSFFYGYMVTPLFGGRLAEIIGPKWLIGGAVFSSSFLSLLIPVAARAGIVPFVTLRVIQGIGEGVMYPAMHVMLAKWASKTERGSLGSIVYSGALVGTIVSMTVSGLLCDSDFLGGWPAVFYVFGILGCVWFIFWGFIIHQSPDKHPRISAHELKHILGVEGDEEIEVQNTRRSIPWRAIMTSVPVWALIIAQFGQIWGFLTLLTELPTYMDQILHVPIKENAVLSALPFLLQAIFGLLSSYIADKILQTGKVRINVIRKTANTIGFLVPAFCLLGVTFFKCNETATVVLLSVGTGINGCIYPGTLIAHVDMSPDYAGTLMGIGNTIGSATGFIVPAFVGELTQNQQTSERWNIVFYTSAILYVVTAAVYVIFGSAELQPWGKSVVTDSNSDTPSLDNSENSENGN